MIRWELGRATGFEPVVSCATDRRLRPLGYARHFAQRNMPPLVVTVFSLHDYVSKKVDGLQEGNNARWGAALN